MTDIVKAYKLARPDGWDFHAGNTINYRANIGKSVSPPLRNGETEPILCPQTVLHACKNPNDCFVEARIPCSAYVVRGIPRVDDGKKMGFTTMHVEREITDLDTLFGWRYSEAINPINPFSLPMVTTPTELQIESLKQWDVVRDSVWYSVWDSVKVSVWDSVCASVGTSVWTSVWDLVRDSVWDSVRGSVGDLVWALVRGSVRGSVRDSVWDSVWASVGAYTGSMFPGITQWKFINHKPGVYPFQPAVDLWKQGLVPSFDGRVWRLHSGPKAEIVYNK